MTYLALVLIGDLQAERDLIAELLKVRIRMNQSKNLELKYFKGFAHF